MRLVPVAILGIVALVGCRSGTTLAGATTTGGEERGCPTVGTLWIGATDALSADARSQSGAVSFSQTCPQAYPDASPPRENLELFDGQGSLWFQSASSLYRWTPGQLQQSCTGSMPALVSFNDGPYAGLAFDDLGNLWASRNPTDFEPATLSGFRAADLQSGQPATAFWQLRGAECGSIDTLCAPGEVAFDSAGYLWVANFYSVLAFSPTALASAVLGDGGPQVLRADLYLTNLVATTFEVNPGDTFYGGEIYQYLAFDSAGDLWVTAQTFDILQILEFRSAELAGLLEDSQPGPLVSIGETPLQKSQHFAGWGAMAFDARGNLWVGSGEAAISAADAGPQPNLFCYSAETLANQGIERTLSILPDLELTVPGDPSVSLAFDPIPPGLPIRP